MKQKTRVLQVINGLNVGGTETFVMNLFRNFNFDKVNVDFMVYTTGNQDFFQPEIEKLGGKVYHNANGTSCYNYWDQMKANYRFFKEYKYDVVHINSCRLKDILVASIPARMARIPVIIAHAHSPGEGNDSFSQKIIKNIMKILVKYTCSDFFSCSKASSIAKFPKSILNQVNYVKNAVNLTRFEFNEYNRNHIRKQLLIDDDTLLIGMVGRFEYEKNHKFALSVFKKLVENKKAHLIFLGNGSLLEDCKRYSEELKVDHLVSFMGSVSNVDEYYSAMDVLLLPSIYEGFPFVTVEAQASGLPIIVSKGVPDECLLLEDSCKVSTFNEKEWADVLSLYSIKKSKDRSEGYTKLKREGFDISDEVKKIVNFYCGKDI